MGSLINNARNFLKGLTPNVTVRAQAFAVFCPNVHRLNGLRTEGYQALRCPTCGEGLFVLPRSPLPEPALPTGATPSATAAASHSSSSWTTVDEGPLALSDPVASSPTGREIEQDQGPMDEVQWVDEEGPAAPTHDPGTKSPEDFAQEDVTLARRDDSSDVPSPRRLETPDVRSASTPRATRPSAMAANREAPGRVASVSPLDWIRAHKNALLFASVVGVVVGAVALRSWRSRWQELPRIAELGRTEGLTALDEGKFDRAQQILSEAKLAVIALNDACQGAAAIRQGADEAAIIAGLAPTSLEEMLDEASRIAASDWEEKFKTLYQGRSQILDVGVSEVPDGQGKGRYEFDYRIFRKGGEGETPRSHGRIDTTGLKRLELIRPRVGDRLTLGVRLASFRYDLNREQWLVGLEPDSGVIMTHTRALEALGWPSAEDGVSEGAP